MAKPTTTTEITLAMAMDLSKKAFEDLRFDTEEEALEYFEAFQKGKNVYNMEAVKAFCPMINGSCVPECICHAEGSVKAHKGTADTSKSAWYVRATEAQCICNSLNTVLSVEM